MALSSQTNEIQRVTHLNYTGWPDHGTPSQPSHLLTFISYMRHIHQSGPVITHCSAGIGRSGTLICIDVVLGLISKDTDVRHGPVFWGLLERLCRSVAAAITIVQIDIFRTFISAEQFELKRTTLC